MRYAETLLFAAGFLAGMLPTFDAHPRSDERLKSVTTWGYQLQKAKLEELARTDCDLLVIDYAIDKRPLDRNDLDRVRGSRQPAPIVLAYVSIGEAEKYRFYWQKRWTRGKPAWLGKENPQWPDNYAVRFWDPEWQRVFLGEDQGYLARIVAAGFDGIYLDRVDVFSDWQRERPTAQDEMIEFVEKLAAHARKLKPAFLIVPQNGEELLNSERFRSTIDGFAKEDLFFGSHADRRSNPEAETVSSLNHLLKAKNAGLPVFVVEYVSSARARDLVERHTSDLGFIPLFAERQLATPPACQ